MLNHFQKYSKVLNRGVILPSISIDQRFYDELGLKNTVSNYEFLRRLCWKGIQDKGIDKLPNKQEYYDRVKRELETFEELGFCPYILLNWQILSFCEKEKIVTGKGRGSCVGSLVLYLLKVTHIDPLPNKLYFERFVSKNRAKKIIDDDGTVYLDGSLLPDCDHDIEYTSRASVINHINDRFDGQTSKILTLNTLSGKMCMKECLKIVEGCSEEDANAVSETIPKKFGKVLDLVDAEKESEKFAQYAQKHQKAFKIAKKLEGLNKNVGVHPSGIAISDQKIDDAIPLQMTKEGDIISGFEMGDVSSLMVKFDILGLRTLSVVQQTAEMVGIDYKSFEPPCEQTYIHLQNLIAPQGIFQIETDTGFRVCQKVKPNSLDELSDVLAISRPGSLSFLDEYCKIKEGSREVAERWPALDKILAETKGTILYQESLMRLAAEVFGLTLLDAEAIRRACGKKKKEEMEVWEPKIYEQAKKLNIPDDVAKFYWDTLIASADYSFNKCLDGSTPVYYGDKVKTIKEVKMGDLILSSNGVENFFTKVLGVFNNQKEIFRFELEDGRVIDCSMEHKFMTEEGMKPMEEILKNDHQILVDSNLEVFKDIVGYEGVYKISNKGTVMSIPRAAKIKTNTRIYGGGQIFGEIDYDGYRRVQLNDGRDKRKKFFVHRLVATAFISNPDNLPCVNHKNGIKLDNSVENLEWITVADNNRHAQRTGLHPGPPNPEKYEIAKGSRHGMSKINEEDVKEMKKLFSQGLRKCDIARKFFLSETTTGKILNGKLWKHV